MRNFSIRRHWTPAPVLILAAALFALAPASAGAHQVPVFVTPPVISGEASVGQTLTVAVNATQYPDADGHDPPLAITYQWQRCLGECAAIPGATGATYTVGAGDLGSALAVAVHLQNDLGSADATAASTPPVASPDTPRGDPPPDDTNRPPGFDIPSGNTAPKALPKITNLARRPAFLRPFPVVRIVGLFAKGGVKLTRLSVAGPRGATVRVTCSGRGCPVRSLKAARAPARLRAFERFLRAGVVLEVRVAKGSRIGKYTSFRIRAHRQKPLRRDACLLPGRRGPVVCPSS